MTSNTFVIEKNYPQAPERVFSAFADAGKKRRWFGDGKNHDIELFEMEFRVGGAERARYRLKEGTPFPGVAIENEGMYLDIVDGERIVSASSMAFGGRRISVTLVTIEILRDGAGTLLRCTHQGVFFDGADGPEMREAGWRELLEKLSGELSV